MIFLKFDSEGNEIFRHYKPHLLNKEILSNGILVQNIPNPTSSQSSVLKYDGKKVYYVDLKTQHLEARAKATEDATLQLLMEGMI